MTIHTYYTAPCELSVSLYQPVFHGIYRASWGTDSVFFCISPIIAVQYQYQVQQQYTITINRYYWYAIIVLFCVQHYSLFHLFCTGCHYFEEFLQPTQLNLPRLPSQPGWTQTVGVRRR